jgi:hypothetical protein
MSQRGVLRHVNLAMLLLWATLGAVPAADTAARSMQRVDWVTYQDPLEHGFTLEVPRGWVIRAGLFRFGLSDVRPLVDLTSPDGRINVRLGDVAIPRYALPSPWHPREGELDDLGAQGQRVVAQYRTGPEFVVLYSHARFSQSCRHGVTDTRDMDFMVPDYLPLGTPTQGTPTQATSTGQIAYHCTSERGDSVAFAFARTYVSGCCWAAPTLASFVTPADQVALARAVLLHILRSFRLRDDWVQQQNALEAEALQYQQDLRRLQAIDQRIAAQRTAAQRYCSQFTDICVADPLTASGSEQHDGSVEEYWTNGLGDVISAPSAPSAGWRALSLHRSSRG